MDDLKCFLFNDFILCNNYVKKITAIINYNIDI
nr:MAG TPA: Pleckstrin homology domain [Caudoviricetes sp.]